MIYKQCARRIFACFNFFSWNTVEKSESVGTFDFPFMYAIEHRGRHRGSLWIFFKGLNFCLYFWLHRFNLNLTYITLSCIFWFMVLPCCILHTFQVFVIFFNRRSYIHSNWISLQSWHKNGNKFLRWFSHFLIGVIKCQTTNPVETGQTTSYLEIEKRNRLIPFHYMKKIRAIKMVNIKNKYIWSLVYYDVRKKNTLLSRVNVWKSCRWKNRYLVIQRLT